MRKILENLFLVMILAAPLWGTSAFAVTYDLTAGVTTVTMPDGQVVTMWGFGLPGQPITVPGPELTVPPGDGTLTINLTNTLPEPVSIIIPGQITAMDPVSVADAQGRQRVRSFTHEAAPGGPAAVYTWNALRPGTYLYQSGTHVAVQVQMGLYGAVKADEAAGQIYGEAFDNDVTLLLSEIDPDLHAAVADGTYGTEAFPSTVDYTARYFLVNGVASQAISGPIAAGAPGDRVLLRLLNAGLRNREPVLQGSYLTFLAQDGNRVPNPGPQYSLDLVPGKTMDAIFEPTSAGYYALFDRALGLSMNGNIPGGMVAYLAVGDPASTLTAQKAGVGSGTVAVTSLPGGIFCDAACIQADQGYFAGTELKLSANAGPGSLFTGWEGCDSVTSGNDCLVAMNADRAVTATFQKVLFKAGAFRQGTWYLDNGNGVWDPGLDTVIPNFGAPSDLAVSGDMNGDGTTEIGTYRPSTGQWFFDLDHSGSWSGCGLDLCITQFGAPTDLPVTGDMNGDGVSEVGVFRPSTGQWFFDLDHSGTWNGCGVADFCLDQFGAPGDLPVVGDWNGTGRDNVGTYRQGAWFLDSGNGIWDGAPTDTVIVNFGTPTDVPVSGDIDANGVTEIGTYRPSTGQWFFDLDHSGSWSGCMDAGGTDFCLTQFGASSDLPVTGNW